MQANPSSEQKKSKRDIDEFDHYFDHILVIDHYKTGKIYDKVVGTYRVKWRKLQRQKKLFYTSGEYDLSKLVN